MHILANVLECRKMVKFWKQVLFDMFYFFKITFLKDILCTLHKDLINNKKCVLNTVGINIFGISVILIDVTVLAFF